MGRPEAVAADLTQSDSISDEEDAAITAAAEADPDNPIWTDEDFARAKPIWAFPDAVMALRSAGALPPLMEREEVTISLDRDLLERLRRAEDGWEDYANAMLRRGLGLPKA